MALVIKMITGAKNDAISIPAPENQEKESDVLWTQSWTDMLTDAQGVTATQGGVKARCPVMSKESMRLKSWQPKHDHSAGLLLTAAEGHSVATV